MLTTTHYLYTPFMADWFRQYSQFVYDSLSAQRYSMMTFFAERIDHLELFGASPKTKCGEVVPSEKINDPCSESSDVDCADMLWTALPNESSTATR